MEGYVAAKQNIFARQQPGDCAVIGIDDQPSRAVYDKMAARSGIAAVPVALERPIAGGVSFRAGMLVDADGYMVDFSDVPTLPGDHNAQNAACASSAGRWLDVPGQREQREARGTAVVLLSPACASWDQWQSYEHRGDAFRAMARALPGAESLGRAA